MPVHSAPRFAGIPSMAHFHSGVNPCAGGQSQYNANQGPRRQPPGPMGRQVPSQYQGDPEDSEDVAGGSPRRSRGLGSSRRRSHPGSSLLEQPNFPSRMRGPGSKSHGPAATSQAGFDDGEADAQQDGELDIIPASMLERQEQNVRGVPASWRETIQDQEVSHAMQAAACGACLTFPTCSRHVHHTLSSFLLGIHQAATCPALGSLYRRRNLLHCSPKLPASQDEAAASCHYAQRLFVQEPPQVCSASRHALGA